MTEQGVNENASWRAGTTHPAVCLSIFYAFIIFSGETGNSPIFFPFCIPFHALVSSVKWTQLIPIFSWSLRDEYLWKIWEVKSILIPSHHWDKAPKIQLGIRRLAISEALVVWTCHYKPMSRQGVYCRTDYSWNEARNEEGRVLIVLLRPFSHWLNFLSYNPTS